MHFFVQWRAGQLIKTKGHEALPKSMLRRWLGACACFFVSGVMHELIYRSNCHKVDKHANACTMTVVCSSKSRTCRMLLSLVVDVL